MNDPKSTTLKQVITAIAKLKITTIVTVVGVFFSYSSVLFMLGIFVSKKDAGIDLQRPFDMRLKLNKAQELYLTGLTIFKNPFVAAPETKKDVKFFVLFRDLGDLQNEQVGTIQVKVKEINIFQYTWKNLFSTNINGFDLYAENSIFDWGDKKQDKEYSQEFAAPKKVLRRFDDGSILEYRIDSDGKSIPGSFKWIVAPKKIKNKQSKAKK